VTISQARETKRSFVLNGILLGRGDIRSRAAVHAFQHGPTLFRRFDLLALSALQHEALLNPALHDHIGMEIIIGTRGSFTPAHVDWYGASAFLQLQEGEKLWWLAPPEREAEFRALFENEVPVPRAKPTQPQWHVSPRHAKAVSVTQCDAARTERMLALGVQAIHQRAGDVVFIPSGWPHAVKNLTDTVAFGNNYIYAWGLPQLISWRRQHPTQQQPFSVPALAALVEGDIDAAKLETLGVRADELRAVIEAWAHPARPRKRGSDAAAQLARETEVAMRLASREVSGLRSQKLTPACEL
jgi:hypothetical protein